MLFSMRSWGWMEGWMVRILKGETLRTMEGYFVWSRRNKNDILLKFHKSKTHISQIANWIQMSKKRY